MKKKGQYIYFILFFIGSFQICGQTIDYKKEASEENSNFYEIVKKTRKEFTNTKKSAKSSNSRVQSKAEKQFERWVWIWKDKVNLDGSFPKNNIDKEEYLKLLTHSSNTLARVDAPTTKTWQQIGPIVTPEVNGYAAYPGMGRINVVAVDKNNAQIMYAGAAAGGVWKTTNGGTTWIPKTDNLAGLGVTDIIIDPNNSSTLYMATGDEDAKHISSIGVFKSTDAGDTWSATGLTFSLNENEYVRDLSFAPGSSTVIFALTNNEVKKSIDSGATWINKPAGNYTSDRFQSIIFDPNDATKVIVSDAYSTLYYSSDSGETFSEHPVYTGVSPKNLKLTTSANDTDHFYGLQQDIRDNSGTITTEAKFIKFRFDNDDTVNDKISETSITGFNSQGGYNQCLAVSPTDKNSIILAGVRGYKSTDNGATFSVYLNPYNNPPGVGFYVHPDHHHLSFLPDGVTVINGHDGGIHKGLISATTGWTDLSNGLLITQPYNISITQGINGDDYMMGNQDNDGFSKVYQTDTNKWVSCLAGDGTATGIDISNSDIRYLGGTYGALYRSDNGYANGYNPTYNTSW